MQIQKNQIWLYDIETLKSCFTYTAINIETGEIVKYVLHKDLFQLVDLIKHLKECEKQIGFNNESFDYPVIHYILLNFNNYTDFSSSDNPNGVITKIYQEAQRIIEVNTHTTFSTTAIHYKEVMIPQVDLFKMWHYNNAARSTSLKALEISMNYPNVMEMPISHTRDDITLEEIPSILEYNENDVLATFEFFKKSSGKISLRNTLQREYGLYCMNWSDSKIGEKLILKLYSDLIQAKPYDISKLRTKRLEIALNDVIFDYVGFNSKEFGNLLRILKKTVITETKDAFKHSVIYKGFKYEYGTGGIHGCIEPGVYTSDEDYVIIDADVTSLYPNLAIQNNLYPEHLGKEFVTVYKQIINLRSRAKKEGNSTLSDGFKLSANSVYGKSNDINSFLYDPKFTMAITLNGQLLLTMLAEELVDRIKDITVLQINTDGITLKIPNNEHSINAYYNICRNWEEHTNLTLEYVEYSKMVIRDVNNYLAVTKESKIKYKGAFEIDKVVGSEPAYHKDNSFKIIPIALSNYFVHNIPVEETIRNHTNIYDFCGRQKFKGQDCGKTHEIAYYKDNMLGYDKITKQQKNVRYYISTNGCTFIKYYAKGTTELINKGYLVTIFNNYVESDDYDIDYNFYIFECYKEIQQIENKQLKLIF